MTRGKGFTLIELLVVVAVIAVLMGVLMPALRRAREMARSIVCSSNMKTLTLGWLLYADSNDNKIVNGLTPSAGSIDPDNPPWVVMPPNPAQANVDEKKEYIKQGALWPYVNDIKVFRCPSDGRQRNPFFKGAFRTYTIPAGLNGEGASWGISKGCKSLSDIKNPSRKYAFIPESDNRGYNVGSWCMQPVQGMWVDAVAMWHRGTTTNFGFVDGHIGRRSWLSKEFRDWCYQSVDEPEKWRYSRDPTQGGEDELKDYRWALDGYAYKALNGPIRVY